jgi:hypothetical protein
MVAYVFVPKELAASQLEELRAAASRQAERFALTGWWWAYRGDAVVFGFQSDKASKSIAAANIFVFNCAQRHIPFRWVYP